MTEVEPEWTAEDRAWAFADLQLEADTCGGCGQPLSESTDPEREGGYEAPLPTRCHACTTLTAQQDKYTEARPGLLFEVHPKRGRR